jgi:hypothetical protein
MTKYKLPRDYDVNRRIEHIDRIRTAYIMYKSIPVATITEEYSSLSGDSDWVIRFIWDNCKYLESKDTISV